MYDEIGNYSIDSESTVYLGGNSEQSNWRTNRVRNQTYHSRILTGIDELGQIYNKVLRDAFWKDFVNNTYEHPHIALDIDYDKLNEL